jgi:hypothetical protein
MACYAIPLYALWAAIPELALWPFQGWPPLGRAVCGRHITPSDTPCPTGLPETSVIAFKLLLILFVFGTFFSLSFFVLCLLEAVSWQKEMISGGLP